MQPDIQVPVLLLYFIKRTAGKLQLRSQVPDQILITLIGKAYRSGRSEFKSVFLRRSAVSCKAAELDPACKCRRLQLVVFGDPNSKRAVRYMKTVTAD